jgi:hypothetical protein
MRRSTAVTVSAALLIAGGIFLGFGALMGILGQFLMRAMSPLPNMPRNEIPLAAVAITFCWEGALATWAIVTAVGIIRLRRWAWISMLILSGLTALFAGFGVVAMTAMIPVMKAMPQTSNLPPSFVRFMIGGLIFTLGIPLSCSIWWLILFTRKSVRIQFQAASLEAVNRGVTADAPAIPVSQLSAISAKKIPLSILIIGIYLLAMVPFSLFSVALPYMRRMPIVLFGQILWPGSGWFYMLALGAVHLALGTGLLMRKWWALLATSAYCVFLIANSLASILRPHTYDRMIEILRQMTPDLAQIYTLIPGMRVAYYFGMLFGLCLPMVGLYFLVTRRKAYREACAGKV